MDLKRRIKMISERLQIQGKNKENTVEGMMCTTQIVAKIMPRRNGSGFKLGRTT